MSRQVLDGNKSFFKSVEDSNYMTREHGRVACATLVKTMAASDDHLVIQDYESGSTIFMDCSAADAAGTIALPLPAVGLSYRIIASADWAANAIVMSSWSNAATRAAVATIFYGVLMDDTANSLVGTTALTFVSGNIEKGDVIDLVSDGTGWHVVAHCATAGAVTVA
jgi:hypothetical protein